MYVPKTPEEKEALSELKRLYGMDWYFIPEYATEGLVKAWIRNRNV